MSPRTVLGHLRCGAAEGLGSVPTQLARIGSCPIPWHRSKLWGTDAAAVVAFLRLAQQFLRERLAPQQQSVMERRVPSPGRRATDQPQASATGKARLGSEAEVTALKAEYRGRIDALSREVALLRRQLSQQERTSAA